MEERGDSRGFLGNRYPDSADSAHQHPAVDGGYRYGFRGDFRERGVRRYGLQHLQCGAYHARVPLLCLSYAHDGRPSLCPHGRHLGLGRRQDAGGRILGGYPADASGYHDGSQPPARRLLGCLQRLDSRFGGRDLLLGNPIRRATTYLNGRGFVEDNAEHLRGWRADCVAV